MLRLKIRVKVILLHNLDVPDGLSIGLEGGLNNTKKDCHKNVIWLMINGQILWEVSRCHQKGPKIVL